jgi:hypothetical protein
MPPAPSHYVMHHDDGGLERGIHTGHMPASLDELSGHAERLPPKVYGIKLGEHDVFVLGWSGASGYRDPLERDPN